KETYYQIDEKLAFKRVEDAAKVGGIHKANDVKADWSVDEASVVVTDGKNRRFRLPKSPLADFDKTPGALRGVREVESERFLANVSGTFYEAPRSATGGGAEWQYAKPVASHAF